MNNSPQNSEAKSSTHRPGIDNSDEEDWTGVVECAVLERSKSERSTRGDEDRRRRTIIVQKKNGSYGFTLQSYGIQYKREQEVEMVTYVDYVECDGPASKAGMRVGDVIVSINGQEMDRADHETLVNFIKNCDSRMRMVVSFEDCLKKVGLHMRYIKLQQALQSRLNELERLCERERSILMGRWKTHSLPARKRTPNNISTTNPNQQSQPSNFNSSTVQCCRPASSTEHLLLYSVLGCPVDKEIRPLMEISGKWIGHGKVIEISGHFFKRQSYADGRPFLIPRSAACLVAVGPPRSRSDHHHFLSKKPTESSATSSRHSYHQVNGMPGTPSKSKPHKGSIQNCNTTSNETQTQTQNQPQTLHSNSHTAHNLCVACISASRRRDHSDGGSLDAYDLASPCCDPNCVPSRRRREKQRRARHEQTLQHQHQQQQQQLQQQLKKHQHQQTDHNHQKSHNSHHCSRASGHSMHSITSSEMSTTVDSAASCSTSVSTDTLYWDPNVQQRPPACLQYAKPKSWDNLTTKAFGGYGFGYGYLDTASIKTHSAERPGKGLHSRVKTPTGSTQRRSTGSSTTTVYSASSNRCFQPTKSTESLLIATPYQGELEGSSVSCECLDGSGSRFVTVQVDKHKRQEESNYSGGGNHQARHRRSSHSDSKLRAMNSSEVTRL